MRTGLAECRSCTQPIRFVQLDTGKAMPINPAPNPTAGNVSAHQAGHRLYGHVISRDKPHTPGNQRFTAHYATCSERAKPAPKPEPETPPALF